MGKTLVSAVGGTAALAALVISTAATAQTADTAAPPQATQLEDVTVVTGQPEKPKKKPAQKKAQPQPVATAPVSAAPLPASNSRRDGPSTAAATGAVNGYVAKESTAGSKTGTLIQDIPQSVSVVGRQEMDDQGVQKADEALRYTAGVFAQPFGSDTDTNWIYIRGFDATQTGIYQDGLQLYSYAFGGFFIDSFALERIEVLKGPASVLYGGSNPGGIINYVSKRPTGERLRYLETGINDAGNAYIGMDIGDRAGPALDYRITGRIAGGDTYSDFQDGFRGFISPTLRWSDDNTSFTLLANYGYIDETHGAGGFLPYVGTVVKAPFGRISPYANYTEPDLDYYKREQGSIGYEFEHKFSSDLIIRQNARYGASHLKEHVLYPNGYVPTEQFPGGDPSTGMLNRINFSHDTTVSTFLLDNQVQWKTRDAYFEHTVLAGVDYKYFNIDQVQAASSGTAIGVRNPIYGAPQPQPIVYLNQDLTQQQVGTYIQDQIRFGGGWLVTLNGRYDWVSTESHDGPTGWSALTSNKSGDDGQASGRAGLAYEFANGVTPYVSAATFFNPVIGTDPSTGNFYVPETGDQYEVGIKYVPKFMDAIITASLFDITRQNVLTSNPSGPNPFDQLQLGEVRSRGFEFEAKANVTENLRVTAAFTAMDLEITKDLDPTAVGHRPFIVPEIMASASADYKFREPLLKGVSIGGGVRYLGHSYADLQNTAKVPEVTLFDARIGYEWNNWGIDLNVINVFDKEYVASCQGTNVCSYGEGRVFKIKSHVNW